MQAYHEQRDTLNRDVDEKEAEGTEVVVDVQERPLDVVWSHRLVLVRAPFQPQSVAGNHTLALVQKITALRGARHQEWSDEADQDCEKPFEEEDVAPSVNDHGSSTPWWNACESVIHDG